MRFDWVNILATVIFVSIVVTLILAVASYFAYKVRESRQPRNASAMDDPKFFNEYRPETSSGTTTSAASTTTSTSTQV